MAHLLRQISNRCELGELLSQLGLTQVGCEIGVFEADYAVALLRTWRGQLLYLVDPWCNLPDYLDSWNGTDLEMQQRYDFALSRLAPFDGRYRILRMVSDKAALGIPDAALDFVYIDANHAYAHVRCDLHAWYPKVRAGGVLAGHDYYDALADEMLEPTIGATGPKEDLTSYGVKSAVDEFAALLGVEIQVTEEQYPTWYFQKPTDARATMQAR